MLEYTRIGYRHRVTYTGTDGLGIGHDFENNHVINTKLGQNWGTKLNETNRSHMQKGNYIARGISGSWLESAVFKTKAIKKAKKNATKMTKTT